MVKPFLNNALIFIDDGLANVQLLRRMLERNGYANVAGTMEPGAVLKRCADDHPDLVLLTLNMPVIDGFAVPERPPSV